jgi:hypothetical protein
MESQMDRERFQATLPSMSYTVVESTGREIVRPTEAQIRDRAHRIWIARDRKPGNPTLDWLQAEIELVAESRLRRPIADAAVEHKGAARRASSMVEASPIETSRFEREDAPGRASRAA